MEMKNIKIFKQKDLLLKDYDVTKNTDWFIVDYENEEN